MNKKTDKAIRLFIPIFIAITGLSGLVYTSVQQVFRQLANDPQIQMAQDAADNLNNGGASLNGLNSLTKIDISKSLSPFYIVFDKNGKVTASDAVLNSKVPTPPQGVFNFENQSKDIFSMRKSIESKMEGNSDSRITWQPEAGVRIAAVITRYNNGYVLAGRNLREVEKREENLFKLVFIAWLFTSAASFLATFFLI